MKLLLENWRQYLAESERMEKAKKEFEKAVKAGYVGPELSFMDWFKNTFSYSTDVYKWKQHAQTKERDLKTIYKKNADRNFLDSLTYIHWTLSGNPVRYLTADRKHQTSAEGYLSNSKLRQHFPQGFNQQGVGIQIRGFVVFGSNTNLQSHSGSAYIAQPGKEASGHVKSVGNVADEGGPGWLDPLDPEFSDLVFDKETFSANTGRFKSNNEFILDNWEPLAIAVVGGRKNKHFDKALQAAQENNLPIIDENQKPIEIKGSNEAPA
jgi:hypothetical protein